jgi:hypothetical protein
MEQGNLVGLAGFVRVKISEEGKIIGDSGWIKNTITDYGLDEGLGSVLIGDGGSKLAEFAALGTGTAPATNSTNLLGELDDNTDGRDPLSGNKATVTSATGAGITARWFGTFASSESRFSTTHDIQNIGLFNISNVTAGTVLAGASFSTSNLNTNQDVQYTYEWRFQTTT